LLGVLYWCSSSQILVAPPGMLFIMDPFLGTKAR
jgi:hypothetical protein